MNKREGERQKEKGGEKKMSINLCVHNGAEWSSFKVSYQFHSIDNTISFLLEWTLILCHTTSDSIWLLLSPLEKERRSRALVVVLFYWCSSEMSLSKHNGQNGESNDECESKKPERRRRIKLTLRAHSHRHAVNQTWIITRMDGWM